MILEMWTLRNKNRATARERRRRKRDMYHRNTHQRKTGITMLISSKADVTTVKTIQCTVGIYSTITGRFHAW